MEDIENDLLGINTSLTRGTPQSIDKEFSPRSDGKARALVKAIIEHYILDNDIRKETEYSVTSYLSVGVFGHLLIACINNQDIADNGSDYKK